MKTVERNVHLVTIAVVDHYNVGVSGIAWKVENLRSLGAVVIDSQTKKVDWHDEHPTNMLAEREDAFREMFKEQV